MSVAPPMDDFEFGAGVDAANATAGLPLNVPYTVSEVLVAVVAVLGNALTITVFVVERKLRRRTNYYIVSLALADLLVGVFGIPFAILTSIGLPRPLWACLFMLSTLLILCTVSIFCLLAVSIDRYWAILYPLRYSRVMTARIARREYSPSLHLLYLPPGTAPQARWPCVAHCAAGVLAACEGGGVTCLALDSLPPGSITACTVFAARAGGQVLGLSFFPVLTNS